MTKPNFTFYQFKWLFPFAVIACCFLGMQNLQAQCGSLTAVTETFNCDGSITLGWSNTAGNTYTVEVLDNASSTVASFPNMTGNSVAISGLANPFLGAGPTYSYSVTENCGGSPAVVFSVTGTLTAAEIAVGLVKTPSIAISLVTPATCELGPNNGSYTVVITDPTEVTSCAAGQIYAPVLTGTAGGALVFISRSGNQETYRNTTVVVGGGTVTVTVPATALTTCGLACGTAQVIGTSSVAVAGNNTPVITASNVSQDLGTLDCIVDVQNSISFTDDNCNGPMTARAKDAATGADLTVTGPWNVVAIANVSIAGNFVVEALDLGTGTHTINYWVSDGAFETGMQTFTITINDVTGPILNTGGGATLSLASCIPGATLPLPDFAGNATDCNPAAPATQTPAAGTQLGAGTHSVTVTASDSEGNSTSETFDVTVVAPDQVLPNTVACNDNVIVALNPDIGACHATITPDMVLEGGNGGCMDNYSVSIQDGNGTDNVLDGIGTYIYVVTGPDGFTCWGQITGEDKLIPEITCVNKTISCINEAVAPLIPFPTATDNCSTPVIQLQSETVVDNICASGTATITRVYIASDDWGNTSAPCTQTITITRTTDVLFPADVIVECNDFSTNPGLIDPTPSGAGIPTNIDGLFCKYQYVYADETLQTCGFGFKIVRTWTVLDWCTNAFITAGSAGDNIQLIKVIDSTPPLVNIPSFEVSANNVGAHPFPCTSTEFLPVPAGAITDLCNDFTLRIFTTVGEAIYPAGQTDGFLGGSIPSPGLEIGPHIITYVAEDVCGNIQIEDVTIEVVDDIPPTAICDSHTQIAITNDGGCSTLSAAELDDGSYDNCNSVFFLMAKMDDAPFSDDIFFRCYYPARDFCCEEAGSSVQVILLVLDGDPGIHFDVPPNNIGSLGCDGTPGLFLTPGFTDVINFNACMVTVDVVDKLVPEITCPGPETISCDFYWENIEPELALATDDEGKCAVLNAWFGDAIATDNCEATVTCSFTNTVDQCGNGTITRSWTANDSSGNGPVSCSQTITVSHVSDWVVEFPDDVILDCGTDSLTIQSAFGEPDFFNVTCELIATSYEDQTFTVVPDACFKVVRTWTILNWCVVGSEIADEVFEETEMDLGVNLDDDGDKDDRTFQDGLNSGNYPIPQPDGFITYQQVVKVIDTVAPQLSCTNQKFSIDNGCLTDIVLAPPSISDCVGPENVTITATSNLPNFDSNTFTATAVPSGTYSVTFTAMDNCGNSNSCQFEVTVNDDKKPTPYCISGLTIELMQSGMIDVWATDFDAGSFDNCTGDLTFSFSGDVSDIVRTFDCTQLGQNSVELWVTDEANNQDFCQVILFIQDNMGACNPDNPMVQGAIENEATAGIQEVEVIINSANGTDLNFLTETSGNFNFPSVPMGGDYTLTPIKNIDPRNGVSTFDLVLLSWHILGIDPLDSPYQLIAADVNRSGSVTTFDMVEIRKLILFINDKFPNNTSWRFVDKDFIFPDPANPFASPFPEVINLNNLTQDELFADFIGVKIGDLNGNATANLLLGSDDRSDPHGELVFTTEDVEVKPGATYTMNFTARNFDVTGFQFTLNFDKKVLEFVGIVPGLVDESNFGLSLLDAGALTASWNASEIIKLSADEILFSLKFKAKEQARLSDLLSLNSRYTVAEAYGVNGFQKVAFEFNELSSPREFGLDQNYPNPFAEATVISFTLPQAATATFTISDVSGKVLKVVQRNYSSGYNKISLNRSELSASGVLYYQLETPTDTAIKKMILID